MTSCEGQHTSRLKTSQKSQRHDLARRRPGGDRELAEFVAILVEATVRFCGLAREGNNGRATGSALNAQRIGPPSRFVERQDGFVLRRGPRGRPLSLLLGPVRRLIIINNCGRSDLNHLSIIVGKTPAPLWVRHWARGRGSINLPGGAHFRCTMGAAPTTARESALYLQPFRRAITYYLKFLSAMLCSVRISLQRAI